MKGCALVVSLALSRTIPTRALSEVCVSGELGVVKEEHCIVLLVRPVLQENVFNISFEQGTNLQSMTIYTLAVFMS